VLAGAGKIHARARPSGGFVGRGVWADYPDGNRSSNTSLVLEGRFLHPRAEMRFSLQVQYAICGVFDLAYNGEGDPIQIRVIGERQGIPARYLEQIFQRLRRRGVVTSKRGPGGGYSLARSPAEISLREIVEAVEGPPGEARSGADPGEEAQSFRPDFLWPRLAERVAGALEETNLEDLCRDAAREEVRRAHPDAPMYFI
jgi:Rrf2 family iron-sulfur cluster assembly transcriptional regulator